MAKHLFCHFNYCFVVACANAFTVYISLHSSLLTYTIWIAGFVFSTVFQNLSDFLCLNVRVKLARLLLKCKLVRATSRLHLTVLMTFRYPLLVFVLKCQVRCPFGKKRLWNVPSAQVSLKSIVKYDFSLNKYTSYIYAESTLTWSGHFKQPSLLFSGLYENYP